MYLGRTLDMDEILEGIEAVTVERVRELARDVFADDGIAVDVLARRATAEDLERRFADGLVLPGGSRLCPA
jgi:predicted Zn-dependent peptidase